MNLVEELNKIAAPRHMSEADIDKVLSEVEANHQDEILKAVGFTRIRAARVNNATHKIPANRIYTYGEIKELCVRYRLRFLSTSRYVGHVPNDLGAAVAQLASNLPPGQLGYGGRFMICAPKETFVRARNVDPVLFYDLGHNRYALVHKWGTDLSWWRKVWAWPLRSDVTHGIIAIALAAAALLICFAVGAKPIGYLLASFGSSLVGTVILAGLGTSDNQWERTYDLTTED